MDLLYFDKNMNHLKIDTRIPTTKGILLCGFILSLTDMANDQSRSLYIEQPLSYRA